MFSVDCQAVKEKQRGEVSVSQSSAGSVFILYGPAEPAFVRCHMKRFGACSSSGDLRADELAATPCCWRCDITKLRAAKLLQLAHKRELSSVKSGRSLPC